MLDFANIDKEEMLVCIYAKKLLEKLRVVNEELLGHGKQTLDIGLGLKIWMRSGPQK